MISDGQQVSELIRNTEGSIGSRVTSDRARTDLQEIQKYHTRAQLMRQTFLVQRHEWSSMGIHMVPIACLTSCSSGASTNQQHHFGSWNFSCAWAHLIFSVKEMLVEVTAEGGGDEPMAP